MRIVEKFEKVFESITCKEDIWPAKVQLIIKFYLTLISLLDVIVHARAYGNYSDID